jgi:predicted TIM-barrel fold metal-dependent hydrolase
MIIDAHNHPDWHGHDLLKFLHNMADCNIDKTWLLSWESPLDEVDPYYNFVSLSSERGPIPFERCLAYYQQAPDKFVLGYAPDPRRPDSIDRLQAAVEIYGVRICGEVKLRMMYDNWDALRLFRFCGEKGLPVTVHLDYEFDTGQKYPRPNWWYGGGIEAFERAVQTCPQTNFVGHAPGFWAHISNDDLFRQAPYPKGPVVPGGAVPRMLQTYPNLFADLSAGSGLNALKRDAAFSRDFLIEFQGRLLYGRDDFNNQLQEFLATLDLPEAVWMKITSQNAERLTASTERRTT